MGFLLVSCDFTVHPDPTKEKKSGPIQLPPEWTATAARFQETDPKGVLTQTQAASTRSSYLEATPTPSYRLEHTPIPYPSPRVTHTPKSQPPSFSGLYFTSAPEAMEYPLVFPCGTREVYAVWEYSNMREGLMVRREWSYDGELWLVREEPWDFQKYGESGEVTDVFIYDYDNGLEPGSYNLDLYIDGNLVEAGFGFRVLGWIVDPLPSPNGSRIASVERPGTLIIQDANGRRHRLLETDEIAEVTWFPDGKHLIYTNVDRSLQENQRNSMGLRFELWVVNVKTKERHRLSTAEERLWKPLVSPDGRYLAAIVGTGWGDACLHDKGLVFLFLDRALQRVAKYKVEDFYGIVSGDPNDTWTIYPGKRNWIDSVSFQVELLNICLPEFEEGVYRLDLATLHAEKIGELGEELGFILHAKR
jgi:hypothetical protein